MRSTAATPIRTREWLSPASGLHGGVVRPFERPDMAAVDDPRQPREMALEGLLVAEALLDELGGGVEQFVEVVADAGPAHARGTWAFAVVVCSQHRGSGVRRVGAESFRVGKERVEGDAIEEVLAPGSA